MQTSVTLLKRLKDPSDVEAWHRFVKLYAGLLYSWARQKTLQPADAENLVQEVLLQLVRELPKFEYDPKQSFRSWLRTITYHKWCEIQRRAHPLNQLDRDVLEAMPETDAEGVFEELEYRRHLLKPALASIRSDFSTTIWEIFQEHVIAGRDAKEVAQAFNMRIGTVYAAKSRVMTRLRTELDGLLD